MAFVVKDYGNGSLGDVDSVSSTINSYARVTAVNSGTITINTSTQISGTATFTVGAKILLHVSATTSSSYKQYLGCYLLANVTAVSSNVLTLDADPTKCIPSAQLANYYVQAIAVAQYKNLTLNSGTTITPPIYNATNFVGGIVALMCSETLTFGGGHISLTDKGIPPANKALRPTTNNDVEEDTTACAGWENSDTHIHFMLNAGDGAAFIIAKSMTCNTSSRIGNTATKGVQFYRGATNSVTYNESKPNGTNVGGSTILIAAETITNFTCNMFAKYRSSSLTAGQGICRCYIASETKLRNDEGLYAYDCISKKSRIKRMGIKNFGDGSFGNLTKIETQLNNYAQVTAINGNKVTCTGATTDGLAPFTQGALVMIHWNHKGTTYVENAGRFILANVLDEYNGVLTLDTTPPDISITNYACQVISIPQANNLTLSQAFHETPSFDGTRGGIFAIAVKNTLTIQANSCFGAPPSGNAAAYGRSGLGVIGNAQDCDKLPIGQGYGSSFILAKDVVFPSTASNSSGGFNTTDSMCALDYCMYAQSSPNKTETGETKSIAASGARGGEPCSSYATIQKFIGGYGSSGVYTANTPSGYLGYPIQGPHLMVVADKITNFTLRRFFTQGGGNLAGPGYGGPGLIAYIADQRYGGYNAGQGGGNSNNKYTGYSGGSSGWAFIYCNDVVNQDTTGTILAN